MIEPYSVTDLLRDELVYRFYRRPRTDATQLREIRTWQLDAIRSLISAIRTLEDVPRFQRAPSPSVQRLAKSMVQEPANGCCGRSFNRGVIAALDAFASEIGGEAGWEMVREVNELRRGLDKHPAPESVDSK